MSYHDDTQLFELNRKNITIDIPIMSRIPPAPPSNKKNSKQPPKPPASNKNILKPLTEINVQSESINVQPIIPVSQSSAITNVQYKQTITHSNFTETATSSKAQVAQTVKPNSKQQTEFQDRQVIEQPKSTMTQIATQQPPIKKIPPPPNNKALPKRQMGTPPPPTIKKQIKRSPPKDIVQTQSKPSPDSSIGKEKIEQTQSPKQIEQPSLTQNKFIPNEPKRQNSKAAPPSFNNLTKQIPKPLSNQSKKADAVKIQTQALIKQHKKETTKSEQPIIDQIDDTKTRQKIKGSIKPAFDKQQNSSEMELVTAQYKQATVQKLPKAKNKFEQKLQRLQKARELMKQSKQQEQEVDLQQQLSASEGSQHHQEQYQETQQLTHTFQNQPISTQFQQYKDQIQQTETKSAHHAGLNQQQQFYQQQLEENSSQVQQTGNVQPIYLQDIQPSNKQSPLQHQNTQNQNNISAVPEQPKIALLVQTNKHNPQIQQLLQKYHSLKNVYLNNLRQLDELVHFQKQQEDHQVQKINHLLNELSKKNQIIKRLFDSKIPSQQPDQQHNNAQEYAEDQFTV